MSLKKFPKSDNRRLYCHPETDSFEIQDETLQLLKKEKPIYRNLEEKQKFNLDEDQLAQESVESLQQKLKDIENHYACIQELQKQLESLYKKAH